MVAKKKRNAKEPMIPLAPVLELVQAAAAARDTFDTLRRGVHFSGPSYEKGYDRLRMSLAYFEKYEGHRENHNTPRRAR